ncbi:helix-turn-helix transcriptional regulator [Paracoccus caeni]|uniref:Helix-turn-helix transcriptional regulator n=1 Tax=Paracoccus caeni TaxID=657651 RepID=A0A934SP52_9RHOB|nr:AraC family transcriptional regulator [Paracoccus caeni]MBK4217873.1 helix-turn-helix transcriptional regulator [Paracoccus caeni]
METINYRGLEVVLAKLDLDQGASWTSAPKPGLWASVLVQGEIDITSENVGSGTFRSGDCHCHFVDSAAETRHLTEQKTNLAGIFIRVHPDEIDALLGEEWAASYISHPFRDHVCNGDPTISALAWQMLGCPMTSTRRQLYITGKALELLSLLTPHDTAETTGNSPLAARSFEVKRVHDARAMLLADLQNPPAIPDLAREVGLNARRLSEVFREVFGATPYALLKATRLDHARLSLESGALTVAQIAHRYGYQPAHFSTEFKRRFGVAPAALLRRGRPAGMRH